MSLEEMKSLTEEQMKNVNEGINLQPSGVIPVLESCPLGVIIVDRTGMILGANIRIVEIFGYSREQLIGKPIEFLVPTDKAQAHKTTRTNWFRSPKNRQMGAGLDIKGRHADGDDVPLDIALGCVETSKGILAAVYIKERDPLSKPVLARRATDRAM